MAEQGTWHTTANGALAGAETAKRKYHIVFQHGTLEAGMYAPRGSDPQQPHDRDEAYVVLSGTGDFVRGDERVAFGPGDLLFVPAGMIHRFENFSDDFATWVIFYGPMGGESA
jgi:mannose-6-phosphate isomerase-like protein (cupin superfamily)